VWSLTSQRERRTSGPENFQSSAKKDFFNTIDPNQTFFHLLPHSHERAMAQRPANIFYICRLALLRCS
jgi:hypothetical protein